MTYSEERYQAAVVLSQDRDPVAAHVKEVLLRTVVDRRVKSGRNLEVTVQTCGVSHTVVQDVMFEMIEDKELSIKSLSLRLPE